MTVLRQPDSRPIILTILLEPRVQFRVEALRRAHYPAALNRVPAHITLFHQLPGRELDAVRRRLKALCGQLPPPGIAFTGVALRDTGVAFKLRAPDLADFRAELADGWDTLLIAQDRAGFQPHLTIQNKVSAGEAKAAWRALSAAFEPFSTTGPAVALWRYCDGPWEALGQVAFRGR
jgi:2'-5' RNA ligase